MRGLQRLAMAGLGLGVLWIAFGSAFSGCRRPASNETVPAPIEPAQVEDDVVEPVLNPSKIKTRSDRIVAVGDVHGDLAATREVLSLAGLIDQEGHWSGGTTILVQTGDILDRGDDEPEILALFWRLQEEALKVGGRVELLLGNHEIMNAQGDFRYVTRDGFKDYADTTVPASWPHIDEEANGLPHGYIGRKAAFVPGSKLARKLSEQNVAVIVGDTVFVHGGLSPRHAKLGIETLNARTKAWLAGEKPIPRLLRDAVGPVWNRDYSDGTDAEDCASLALSLAQLGVKRMVVGHTVQRSGINGACNQMVWRIDVGMSSHYGGSAQALEIVGDRVRVLSKTKG